MPMQQQDAGGSSSRRTRLLAPGFSLRRHLTVFAVLSGGGMGFALWLLRRARVVDLWIVPAYLVVANLVEYGVHRGLMHRPLWPRALYRGHTLGHHRAFHHDSMEIMSWRELELVMMPWFTILLFFLGMVPLVAVVAWGLGSGAAGLFLLTGVTSFVTYEGMHALYHLPAGVLVRFRLSRNRWFGWLHGHHRHHHRLARMRWVNFNISCPLTDRLFGTMEDERHWNWERDRRAAERAEHRADEGADETADEPPASPRRQSSGAG
jgi:hypothetical protein